MSWAKLFPEDTHEDGEEVEEGGESFPVLIALKGPKSATKANATGRGAGSDDDSSTISFNSKESNNLRTVKGVGRRLEEGNEDDISAMEGDDDQQEMSDVVEFPDHLILSSPYDPSINPYQHTQQSQSRFHRPNLARGHIKGGFLSDMQPEFSAPHSQLKAPTSGLENAYSILRTPNTMSSNSPSASALQSEALQSKLNRRGSVANLDRSAMLTAQALASMALNKPTPIPAPVQHLARIVSTGDVQSTAESKSLPPVKSLPNLKMGKGGVAGETVEVFKNHFQFI